MTQITFPVPAIKFGKSDALLLLCMVQHALEDAHSFPAEDMLDIEAMEEALIEFLK